MRPYVRKFHVRRARVIRPHVGRPCALGVSVRRSVRRSRRPLSANPVRALWAGRPSSPEAVRPYFRSRAIRQALIRAPCFGPAVRRSAPSTRRPFSLPSPHAVLSALRPLTPNRPSGSLSLPSSDRTSHSTHPEASTRVLYAVLVCHTTMARNTPYFETSCEKSPCSTGARQTQPDSKMPHLVLPT